MFGESIQYRILVAVGHPLVVIADKADSIVGGICNCHVAAARQTTFCGRNELAMPFLSEFVDEVELFGLVAVALVYDNAIRLDIAFFED